MKACDGKNDNCDPDCERKSPHDDCTCWSGRCVYPGSDAQFDIVQCVEVDGKELDESK